ncbi:hypothetical protein DID76_04085 [Candidatus Marinamargulisbacteria bacterium SCGC AG-414-C22]|nr:hypothetical protein DID76_04085 [Candidatus Marinamargulisbacteria bacterium SCGC AG-414-C22]
MEQGIPSLATVSVQVSSSNPARAGAAQKVPMAKPVLLLVNPVIRDDNPPQEEVERRYYVDGIEDYSSETNDKFCNVLLAVGIIFIMSLFVIEILRQTNKHPTNE